jgi:iron-binding CDGSH zinc finger protein
VNDVTITPTDNGPYLIHGNVTLLDAEGNRFEAGDTIALCRCVSATRNRSATARTNALTSQPPAAPNNSLLDESSRATEISLRRIESTVRIAPKPRCTGRFL